MKINQKFKFVNGNFDTKKGELIAVPSSKYNEVHLCFKGNMHVPFARIKLHSRDTFGDAQEVYKDAENLANEIARRFNEFPEERKK